MVEGPVGFWSYVRADNEAADGAILELRNLIINAYALITGDDLTLFVDQENITWGQEWQTRIADSIAGTTFFIPIITPRFFRSQACRQEVIDFTTKATEASGLNELFLPILYVDVPGMNTESTDPVVRLVAKTQYVRWDALRLLDTGSSEHRIAVHKLAAEISRISQHVELEPEVGGGRPSSGDDDDGGDDDAPGSLDLINSLEESFPQLGSIIEGMASCLDRVGEIGRLGQPALENSAKSSSTGPRLVVLSQIAAELGEPTQDFLDLATEYAELAIDLNAGIDALIHLNPPAELGPAARIEFREFADSIRGLRDGGVYALTGAKSAMDSVNEVASLSRAMKKPASNLRRGVERLSDVQGLYEEWVKKLTQSGVWDNESDDPTLA